MSRPDGLRALLRHSAVKFAGVGVLNTLLSVAVIFGLKALAGFGDVPANLSGYVVAVSFSFVVNRRWTFRHEDHVWTALARFLLVFAVSYLLNLALVLGLEGKMTEAESLLRRDLPPQQADAALAWLQQAVAAKAAPASTSAATRSWDSVKASGS